MEENQSSSLFGLSIDQSAKTHLSEAARWARFLAIVGFIMCGLIALFGLFAGTFFSRFANNFGAEAGTVSSGAFGFMFMAYAIIGIIIYFFPCLFLYRFANKMKAALASNDQENLNGSFQNLKITFRYFGILTIIVLAFYAIGLISLMLGVGLSKM